MIYKIKYYKNLPEKARRHFLALKYDFLGLGSQKYMDVLEVQ